MAGIPRVTYARAGEADLIHSCRHLVVNHRPWVVEVEMASAFAWYSRKNMDRPQLRHAIERLFASPWCRRIMPWTEAAKKSLLNAFQCSDFARKIEVVYPCIAAKKVDLAERQSHREVTLLFVGPGFYGAGFYNKGGVETLLAFDQLSKRYPALRLEMVCLPPPAVQERWGSHPKITFRSRIPNAELDALFRKADIFVLPTHMDSLGFVYLEAFSYGVPCVGSNHFAVPEIITHGKTGCLVDCHSPYCGTNFLPRYESPMYEGHPLVEEWKRPPEQYVGQVAEAIAHLVENPALRWKMSAAAYDEVSNGRFSVARRRRELRSIYEKCLDFEARRTEQRSAAD
jgi:glycosyltransferase involved in cell wall biosynthesis